MSDQPEALMQWARDAGSTPEDLVRFATLTIADRDAEIERLYDKLDYTKKGLAEWREEALRHMQQVKAAQATARVAIRHLKAVLADCAYDPVRADMEAQDWLVSIGDDSEGKP